LEDELVRMKMKSGDRRVREQVKDNREQLIDEIGLDK
jgi:hypothetical protein